MLAVIDHPAGLALTALDGVRRDHFDPDPQSDQAFDRGGEPVLEILHGADLVRKEFGVDLDIDFDVVQPVLRIEMML